MFKELTMIIRSINSIISRFTGFSIVLIIMSGNITVAQNYKNILKYKSGPNTYSDSLLKSHLVAYKKAVANIDTVAQVKVLLQIAHYYGNQAKYKDSYDNLWAALNLAEQSNYLEGIATINLRLGRHYGFYGKKNEALKYFNDAMLVKNAIIRKDPSKTYTLVENYHQLCSYYRDFNEVELHKKYLDSCKMFLDVQKNNIVYHMITMEEAVNMSNNGKYDTAEILFDKSFSEINEKLKTYLVLHQYFEGLNYFKQGKTFKAEEKLKHALEIGYKYNFHLDFVPKIYKVLFQIYLKKGETTKALEMLNEMNAANFDFFDSRSGRNQSLLEIQDEHRAYNEKQMRAIQLLQLEELKNTRKVLFLQRGSLIIGIILLCLFAFLYVKYLTKKYKLEKQLIKSKQEVEVQKVKEVIELKNRELAITALKLIEKDEFVKDFSETLKKNNWVADSKLLKSFVRNWGLNLNKNWDEFQIRFTEINSSFYENLHRKFPNISSSDDKLCALIKLQFSSKDIAQLLGLSIESVQVKRSRLRTKLNLDRDVNLVEFISKF